MNQRPHRSGVAFGGGDVQGGALVVVARVGRRARGHQSAQQRQIALKHARAQLRRHGHPVLAQPARESKKMTFRRL